MVPDRRRRTDEELLEELRGQTRRRRARRRRQRALWMTTAVVVTLILAVIPIRLLSENNQKLNVGGLLGSSALTTTGPEGTIGPGTRPTTVPRPTTTVSSNGPQDITIPGTIAPGTTVPPGTSASATTVSPPASPTKTIELPVTLCPTTFGAPPPPMVALAPIMPAQVAPDQASQLGVYTDSRGIMKLVAPIHWACRADYGANGTGGVLVYLSGESPPPNWGAGWPLPAHSPIQAVVGFETSACAGCTNGQACPLFTAAALAFQSQFLRPCPGTKPPAEIVYPVNMGPGVVGFEDPPGTAGDGVPSGGAYPANGVMTYYGTNGVGSWRDTCTMPSSEQPLCTAALNNFLDSYGAS
jgi:hypothetical protein